jgi:hypothetical protein
LNRDPRAYEDRRTTEDFGIAMNDGRRCSHGSHYTPKVGRVPNGSRLKLRRAGETAVIQYSTRAASFKRLLDSATPFAQGPAARTEMSGPPTLPKLLPVAVTRVSPALRPIT